MTSPKVNQAEVVLRDRISSANRYFEHLEAREASIARRREAGDVVRAPDPAEQHALACAVRGAQLDLRHAEDVVCMGATVLRSLRVERARVQLNIAEAHERLGLVPSYLRAA